MFAEHCERLIQVDPARRGLLSAPVPAFACGQLGRAARDLAKLPLGSTIGIITGFPIAAADPVMHETDGPLGAWFLARAAAFLGYKAWLAEERKYGEGLWELVGDAGGDLADAVDLYDLIPGLVRPNCNALIAIERPGPSRRDGTSRSAKGVDISRHVVDTSAWFLNGGPPTIGIGDGGNEIGMGAWPADDLERRVPFGGAIACGTPCDHLIAAGVSNWGGYALGLCWAEALGKTLPPHWLDPENERRSLRILLDCGMVDGGSGRPDGCVDGLEWEEYIRPFMGMTRISPEPANPLTLSPKRKGG